MSALSNCYYHPDKKAVTRCRICKMPICFDDKRIFNSTWNFSMQKFDYDVQCIICFTKNTKEKYSGDKFMGIVGPFVADLFVVALWIIILSSYLFPTPKIPQKNSYNGGGISIWPIVLVILGFKFFGLIYFQDMINDEEKAIRAEATSYLFIDRLNDYKKVRFEKTKSKLLKKYTFLFKGSCLLTQTRKLEKLKPVHCSECQKRVNFLYGHCLYCGETFELPKILTVGKFNFFDLKRLIPKIVFPFIYLLPNRSKIDILKPDPFDLED